MDSSSGASLPPRRCAITTQDPVLRVLDQPGASRFVLEQEGELAELEYELRDGRMVLIHTEVPSPLAGRGVGGRLVEAAVERARRDGLSIEPQCRFARGWLRRHPEVAGTVSVEWPQREGRGRG